MRNLLFAFAMTFFGVLAVFGALTASGPARAVDEVRVPLQDPLKSGMLAYHQKEILGDPAKIRIDDRVVVRAPRSAEDSFHVPVLVDATAIPSVKRIVLFVDYGPIPKILTYWPGSAEAKLAFRFKIDQATPVRAAVETEAGSWHVGSTQIDAAGGGCTAPAHAYASDDWEEHLGKVRGKIWPGSGRLRVVVDHPMDTGLADGIPVFIIEKLRFNDAEGRKLAEIDLHEPVNEDPAFTLYLGKNASYQSVRVEGRDNNGNLIKATLRSGLTQ